MATAAMGGRQTARGQLATTTQRAAAAAALVHRAAASMAKMTLVVHHPD